MGTAMGDAGQGMVRGKVTQPNRQLNKSQGMVFHSEPYLTLAASHCLAIGGTMDKF